MKGYWLKKFKGGWRSADVPCGRPLQFLLSPTQECRTAETLFATPQRLGTSCGGRHVRRHPLASPPAAARQPPEARLRALEGFVALRALGPSNATTPRRQDGTATGRSSPSGAALEAMLRSPEQPGDALQAPDSDFRYAMQCALLLILKP